MLAVELSDLEKGGREERREEGMAGGRNGGREVREKKGTHTYPNRYSSQKFN